MTENWDPFLQITNENSRSGRAVPRPQSSPGAGTEGGEGGAREEGRERRSILPLRHPEDLSLPPSHMSISPCESLALPFIRTAVLS